MVFVADINMAFAAHFHVASTAVAHALNFGMP